LWLAVADSQGGIGHILAAAIDTALARRGLAARAVAVLTHAEVARDDPAIAVPTKPIGSQMTSAVARLAVTQGWTVTETSSGVFRRVVPSPRPHRIVEADQIRTLLGTGAVVVAAGGGGIPVLREDGGWRSVDAVIDKDRASAMLAAIAGVDALVLVTGVEQVYVGFGTPDQQALADVRPAEARGLSGRRRVPRRLHGAEDRVRPAFLAGGGRRAVITSLQRLRDALTGRAGTSVTWPNRGSPMSSSGASR
jgi:carbamate kinase